MIGERIREIRLARGLSITSLSQQAGVAKSYISRIERGLQRNPSMDFIAKVAVVLETDLLDLIATEESGIDQEWLDMVRAAIAKGIKKEQFQELLSMVLSMRDR